MARPIPLDDSVDLEEFIEAELDRVEALGPAPCALCGKEVSGIEADPWNEDEGLGPICYDCCDRIRAGRSVEDTRAVNEDIEAALRGARRLDA